MAYRDDLETRRAHLRRLEAQLEELKQEEARIRAMPGPDAGVLDRALGGPKVIEREVPAPRPLDEAELAALADQAFEVEGRIRREGGVLIWRGEPEPRPRRVEVRVEPDGDGCVVRVRDQGSWRLYAGFAGFLGLLPQLFRPDFDFGTVMLALALLGIALLFLSMRGRLRKNTRRRIHQTEAFTTRVAAETESEPAAARVRVEGDAEEVEVEEAVELEAAPRKAAAR